MYIGHGKVDFTHRGGVPVAGAPFRFGNTHEQKRENSVLRYIACLPCRPLGRVVLVIDYLWYMSKIRKPEEALHNAVCDYLRAQYPNTVFTSDQSGLKAVGRTRLRLLRTRNPQRGIPDLLILHARPPYGGCALELKADGIKVLRKDGTPSKDKHITEQRKVLAQLRASGWYAEFAIGFDDAKQQIDRYFQNSSR